MDLSNISSKSTKRQIWEAYQAILGEMASRKQPAAQDNAALTELPPVLESEEQKILARASELKAEAVTNDLNNIKASSAEMLDRLSEKLIGELKKLETVKQAVVLENHNLESLYKIKAEADTLLDLIALREQKRDDFQKTLAEEEEKLKFEIEQKRKQASREDEEYAHKLKLTRQKEQGDYEFKNYLADRERNEKNSLREKELRLREDKIAEQEAEIKSMRAQIQAWPAELEKIKAEAIKQTKIDMEKQIKIDNELRAKDFAREQEIAELKITALEDTMKKQTAQIHSLESQLAISSQKAQQLAIKIIEAGGAGDGQKILTQPVNG